MDSTINPYQAPESSSPPAVTGIAEQKPNLFQSARAWGIIACFGIAANLIVALSAMAISFALLSLYDVDHVEQIDPAQEQSLLFGLNVTFIGILATRLLTAIPFMVWMYKVYVNLLALGHAAVDWK